MKKRIDQSRHAKFARVFSSIALMLAVLDSVAAMDGKEAPTPVFSPDAKDAQPALQDLVRAEAALALTQMQEREMQAFQSKTGLSSPEHRNEVRSIFGVGSRLYAELVLLSKPYLFVSGQSRPVEGPDRQWKLQRIQPPCIYLQHEDRPKVLCLGASIE